MKFIIAVLSLAQIVLSAPSEPPTFVDQAQATLSNIQKQATDAVSELNSRFLEATGAKSNTDFLSTVQQQGQDYAGQIKGVTDQINQQVQSQTGQLSGFFTDLTKQLTEATAKLLGGDDPNKVEQLQTSFNNVLTQANTLNEQLKQQGDKAQASLKEATEKLYQNTLETANKVAAQLDAAKNSQ